MLRRTTPTRLAIPAAAALVFGLATPALHAAADTTPAEECVQAGNVWVHVQYDDSVAGACATEFATAQDALLSTGVTEDEVWIQTVDGRLAEGKEWWSVYSLAPDADGAYPAEWAFAEVGVAQLELSPSSVVALQLQADYELDSVPPTVNPVEGVVLSDDESPAPSPSPEPTATATVTTKPTVSATPAAPGRPGMPKTGR